VIHKLPPVENPSIPGVTAEEWNLVVQGMIGATSWPGGTATAFVKGTAYTMAGKTGTAEVVTVARNQSLTAKKTDERLKDHAWFIAFAPAEAPRIAIAVLAENAGFGSGSSPIARKVMDAYLLGADGKLKPSMEPGARPTEDLPPVKPAPPSNATIPDQKQAESPPPPEQAHKQS
jgi:penicillin-binding protein 2